MEISKPARRRTGSRRPSPRPSGARRDDTLDQYRTVFESCPDAILITDSDGWIVEANSAACALLGYRRDRLVGRNQLDFVPPVTRPDANSGLALLRAGHTVLTERLIARRDSSTVWVEISARMLPGGRTQAFVRDISARKVTEAQRLGAAPAVLADPGQIEDILLNLAANSRDAMPEGGTFTVVLEPVELDEQFVSVHAGAAVGRHVMLSVSDTGTGMDDETQAHVFEPFFSTKSPGKGTGLGLASVYGIVKQSDGYIGLESTPGLGSKFRIYLPAVEQVAIPISLAGKPQCDHRGGHERILLVEDDPSVRSFAQFALERHGYQVVAFAEPEAALQAALADSSVFDGMVTDIVMPGMSGPTLAERIRGRRPGLPVLYMSGHDRPAATDPARCDDGRTEPRLAKPFGSCELALAVGAMLGQ